MEVDSTTDGLGLGHSRSASYASQHSRCSGYARGFSSSPGTHSIASRGSSAGADSPGTGRFKGFKKSHSRQNSAGSVRSMVEKSSGQSLVHGVRPAIGHNRQSSLGSGRSFSNLQRQASIASFHSLKCYMGGTDGCGDVR